MTIILYRSADSLACKTAIFFHWDTMVSGASAEKRGFVSLPFTLYQLAFFGTKSNYY